MDMTLTGLDIVRFGIFIYVALWFVFFCYVNIYSGRKNQNVHKVAKWSSITVVTRWFGWKKGAMNRVTLSTQTIPGGHILMVATYGKVRSCTMTRGALSI